MKEIDREIYLKERKPITDKCGGCKRIVEGPEPFFPRYAVRKRYCRAYLYPQKKWGKGQCNFCTHTGQKADTKKVVNPLKASRRKKARGFV